MRNLMMAGVSLAAAMMASPPVLAAELVMLSQPGCAWCLRFNKEIAPAYGKTAEGKFAPLRDVDITGDWPADLPELRTDRFTPTFVLVDGGREIARMRGYAGDEFFWFLLGEMLAKLPDAPKPSNG